MTYYSGLDGVFAALASGPRRHVVATLAQGQATVGDLAAPFDMALPSFLRHIQVLDGAACVHTEKSGRVRTCRLTPGPFDLAEHWLAEQRGVWAARTDRLEQFLRDEEDR